MIPYRDYQSKLVDDIYNAWAAGAANVMPVLPTGAGKTVVFSGIQSNFDKPSISIAHRQELVGQMSLALARNDVPHRIIASDTTLQNITRLHVAECGMSYIGPQESRAVAGVDTLIRDRARTRHARFLQSVGLWTIDEGHHVLTGNKWGKAASLFTDALGLLVTATPGRADGKGLGRHADGLVDQMIIGPSMRDLINRGYLTDYRIFAPPSDFSMDGEKVGSTGDWSNKQMRKAARKSHIIGDVVDHYMRICPGKLGVTFAPDVETAKDITARFNAAGIPAEIVTAKTLDNDRESILQRYRRREILMLVNVDLFGEGFDLPAIEVVIMARPTESFSLYCQQFGRVLRLMLDGPAPNTDAARLAAIAASSKPYGLIIDHVGNVVRHGLPDARRDWTLDRRDRKSRGIPDDVIPLRACLNTECMQVYERIYPACPFCGHKPEPANRSAPEFVDGDLFELDPAVLAQMRGEVEAIDMNPAEYRDQLRHQGCPPVGQNANVKRHMTRQEVQAGLRDAMAWWAGYHAHRSQSENERRFYHTFGIDVLSAKALGEKEATRLTARIYEAISQLSI